MKQEANAAVLFENVVQNGDLLGQECICQKSSSR